MEKALKETQKMENKEKEPITIQTEAFIREIGLTISSMASEKCFITMEIAMTECG